MRAADESVGHLADVNEPRIFQADVDERSEVNNVQNSPVQFHTRCQVVELQNAAAEDRARKVRSRISARPTQCFDNVFQSWLLASKMLYGNVCETVLQSLFALSGSLHVVGLERKAFQQSMSDLVTFRVNPGLVERFFTVADLQEACRLSKS